MKIGDLVKHRPSSLNDSVGVIIDVKECWVGEEYTGGLSVESYWPALEGRPAGAFKRNNTHEPWFGLEVVND